MVLAEIGVTTSLKRFDIAIESISTIHRSTQCDGISTIGLSETFRLLGNFNSEFEMNRRVHYSDLDLNIIQHIEFKEENLIGLELNATLKRTLNDQTLKKSIGFNLIQSNEEFQLFNKRDLFKCISTSFRVIYYQHTFVLFVFLSSIVVFIFRKLKTRNQNIKFNNQI